MCLGLAKVGQRCTNHWTAQSNDKLETVEQSMNHWLHTATAENHHRVWSPYVSSLRDSTVTWRLMRSSITSLPLFDPCVPFQTSCLLSSSPIHLYSTSDELLSYPFPLLSSSLRRMHEAWSVRGCALEGNRSQTLPMRKSECAKKHIIYNPVFPNLHSDKVCILRENVIAHHHIKKCKLEHCMVAVTQLASQQASFWQIDKENSLLLPVEVHSLSENKTKCYTCIWNNHFGVFFPLAWF